MRSVWGFEAAATKLHSPSSKPLLLLAAFCHPRRYYSPEIHQASFVLPAFAQKALAGSLTSF